MLSNGESVVLDGTFLKESMRQIFKNEILAMEQKVFFIEIKSDEVVIKERVSKRREFSEADFAVYLKLKSEFEPMADEHLVLWGDRSSTDHMLEEFKKYLEKHE
jgi:predicted kinase